MILKKRALFRSFRIVPPSALRRKLAPFPRSSGSVPIQLIEKRDPLSLIGKGAFFMILEKRDPPFRSLENVPLFMILEKCAPFCSLEIVLSSALIVKRVQFFALIRKRDPFCSHRETCPFSCNSRRVPFFWEACSLSVFLKKHASCHAHREVCQFSWKVCPFLRSSGSVPPFYYYQEACMHSIFSGSVPFGGNETVVTVAEGRGG